MRITALLMCGLAACDFAGPAAGDPGAPLPPDAGAEVDAAPVAPPCDVTPERVRCEARFSSLDAGGEVRDVYWQLPASPPPPAGYRAVVVYQGSFFGPSQTWGVVVAEAPFGGYHQARLQALLLERGFAVIAPSAAAGVAWQTNSGVPWELTGDRQVIDALLAAIAAGDFGPIDTSRLFATGISSGGYMTSRMAVSYPGAFAGLAIHSASYATCLGALCAVPETLPVDHPPTLFLHGRLDPTVPLGTARPYHERLVTSGIDSELVIDDDAGHEWLAVAPEAIVEWFAP